MPTPRLQLVYGLPTLHYSRFSVQLANTARRLHLVNSWLKVIR